MKKYKPKANVTLRKYVHDIIQHCGHVSGSEFFGCHTCAYNVQLPDGKFGCYFEQLSHVRPADWDLNKMGGRYV